MKPSLVIVSYLLASTCLPTSTAKRSAGLPLSRARRGQSIPDPPRGGGAVKPLYTPGRIPIELNPNYVGWQSQSAATVAKYEEPSYTRTTVMEEATLEYEPSAAAAAVAEYRAGSMTWGTLNASSSSWLDSLKIQFLAMYRSSPSLMATMVSCVLVFLAWQVQPRASLLNQYFVISRANMRAFRWPSLFLSAVSHMDFWHLLVNMYGLWSFGPSVQRTLQQVNQPLGPFLGGAALASSLVFLLLQSYSGSGGALGLSGVTLALLAVHARTNPKSVLSMRVAGIIPIRMKAESLLICLTAWSFVGSFAKVRSNVGHAAHLGGLLFGVAYHQFALRQRTQRPLWQYQ